MDATLQAMICAEALSWVGTPYHHKARIKGVAVDCGQLLAAVFCDALQLVREPDVGDYPPDWMKHRSEERFLQALQTCAREVFTPEPGDIAIWMWGRCFAHAAIIIDWPMAVHADIRVGKVTPADVSQGRFAARPVQFYRVNVGGEA